MEASMGLNERHQYSPWERRKRRDPQLPVRTGPSGHRAAVRVAYRPHTETHVLTVLEATSLRLRYQSVWFLLGFSPWLADGHLTVSSVRVPSGHQCLVSITVCRPHLLFLKGRRSCKIGAHPYDLIVPQIPL